ncbi:transposase and inactivated derivatives [Candidatus Vecturithrix granuli]|uniref:Transposase and inactivated derivatives n=1 Tax=Vecturithrix granuli TaxID=1499967 RepID=A0A0S6W5N7_VECG1|nr:transposase and inactivated derivatives [Candidatus Vecturithrix granuli]
MKPISPDLRARIVEVYEEGQLSYATVAERFCVSESSVKNFVKHGEQRERLTRNQRRMAKPFCLMSLEKRS